MGGGSLRTMDPDEVAPGLSERQQRFLLTGGIWGPCGGAVMIGWLGAVLMQGASPRFIPMQLVVFGIMLAAFVVSMVMTIRMVAQTNRRLSASLSKPRGSGPVVPAVLVRAIPARRPKHAQQLLYAARMAGGVGPVAVALPAASIAPRPGTGAWLALDPAEPDIAHFAEASVWAERGDPAADPALARPTKVESGLALPGRAYLRFAFVVLLVLIGSFVVSNWVLLIDRPS